MKITKYPQSCMIIENNGERIIIDPGSLVFPKFSLESLLPISVILITHEHSDHADSSLIANLLQVKAVPVIANDSTQAKLGDVVTQIVKDGDTLEIGGFKIIAKELPHVDMIDGSKGPKNTGYIINDVFFHPGDGITIQGLNVNTAAVPIAGPDISFRDVYGFIKDVKAKKVIPMHYDYYSADPDFMKKIFTDMGLESEIINLQNGQSCDI